MIYYEMEKINSLGLVVEQGEVATEGEVVEWIADHLDGLFPAQRLEIEAVKR